MPEHPGRHRGWVFTINNHTSDDVEMVKAIVARSTYVIAGLEVGEQGTPHIQGYAYYANARSFAAMKKALPRANLQPAKGTGAQNKTYCSKDGNILVEDGIMPTQGKRVDLDEVYASLREGANMRSILDSDVNLQCIQVAQKYLSYHEAERDWQPEVRWFHGPPGAGKTRAALEWLGDDTYTCNRTTSKFWDGYDAHQGVLIDDFRTEWCKFVELLGITDRYAYRVEVKGGARQLLARKIAITSPYSPEEAFTASPENLDQILRRISEIHEFTGVQSPPPLPARYVDGIKIPPAELISNPGSELPDAYDSLQVSPRWQHHSHRSRPCSPVPPGWSDESCGPSDDSVPSGKVPLPVRKERRQSPLQVCYDPQEGGFKVSPEEDQHSCSDEGGHSLASYTSEQSYPDWPTYDGLQEDDDAHTS